MKNTTTKSPPTGRHILVSGKLPEHWRSELEKLEFTVTSVGFTELTDSTTFKEELRGKTVYISGGSETATQEVLSSTEDLRLVVFLGADYGAYVDAQTCVERGIYLCNTPGANSDSVAEFTVALMLSAWCDIPSLVTSVKDRLWPVAQRREIKGKRLGIVGLGRIGRRVAEIASLGMGMKVSYWSRERKISAEAELGIDYLELRELLNQSDVVSLHSSGDAGVLLSDVQISWLKKGAVIINTARPSLIDPQALLEALKSESVSRAAFDSFYGDNANASGGAEAELLSLPSTRFIITPHVAWRTDEADDRMFASALKSIGEFLDGKRPSTSVSQFPL